jgi:exopolyphosphatase/guanosine-5'-triphosphate,3'-diphosphate pyrophosphatase
MSDELIEPAVRAPKIETKPTASRWEWRAFARGFGKAESRLRASGSTGAQDSDEIYLISRCGENVKVRDGLMDVKVLRETDDNGLELWAPVLKKAFPLSSLEAQKVVQALRIPVYELQQDSYTLRDTLEALGRPDSGVRIVNVHKHRQRYSVEGCMAELSDITVDGIPVRTIAVESENADAVVRAVHSLGLTGYANTSYPRGLTNVMDGVPERYAVIDAGTNSIKFHIGERDYNGSWRSVVDRAELTRLGQGLSETGRISQAALERTVEAVAGMASEAKSYGVRAVAGVGTAGLRIAANASEVIAKIRARTGVQIEVLSGEEEARLAYLATISEVGPTVGSVAVFDTGGGSSQFTFGHSNHVDERFSLDVGAAGYAELFHLDGTVPLDVLEEALQAIDADLSPLDGRQTPDLLIGMGGAVTNITAVALALAQYDPRRVQGALITSEEIDRQIDLYRSLTADARRSIVGLQPIRAEVILAGACIVRTILRKLRKDSLVVSDRGLRHGVLAERFGTDPSIEAAQ